jgi:hypothetical protein
VGYSRKRAMKPLMPPTLKVSPPAVFPRQTALNSPDAGHSQWQSLVKAWLQATDSLISLPIDATKGDVAAGQRSGPSGARPGPANRCSARDARRRMRLRERG